MVALIRNSGTRLSNITDAFSRLQLQHTDSSFTSLCPSQLRFITQTRPNLLKSLAGANSSTTIGRDRSPHKHADISYSDHPPTIQLPPPRRIGEGRQHRTTKGLRRTYPKWEEGEDRRLYQLVKEGVNAFDIYANHFQHRSSQAVNLRASWAANLARIQDQQARDGVRPGEIDIAKSVAGEAGAPPLRTVYDKTRKVVKANRREANSDDGPTQRPYTSKRASFLKKEWTAEEDALLRQLVERNIGLPEQTLWTKVSGGNVAGSLLLRAPVACNRRWMHLHPSQETRTGHWTKAEELRLQQAISRQLEGKYQVIVDVLLGQPAATENRLKDWCPHLQQLQGQEGLPILKLGSKQLKMLSWIQIAEEVKSRNDQACRDHFYSVYNTSARGHWTKEESRRMKEGQEMFGKDYWKIAEHIGTRSPSQVTNKICNQNYRRRKMGRQDAVGGEEESVAAASKKQ